MCNTPNTPTTSEKDTAAMAPEGNMTHGTPARSMGGSEVNNTSDEDDLGLLKADGVIETVRDTESQPHKFEEEANVPEDSEEGLRSIVEVCVSPVVDRWRYQSFPRESTVADVVEALGRRGDEQLYRVAFEDGRTVKVSLSRLLKLRNGSNALDLFENNSATDELGSAHRDHSSGRASMSSGLGKRNRKQTRRFGHRASSEDGENPRSSTRKRIRTSIEDQGENQGGRPNEAPSHGRIVELLSSDDSDSGGGLLLPWSRGHNTRSMSSGQQTLNYKEGHVGDADEEEDNPNDADGGAYNDDEIIYIRPRRRTKSGPARGKRRAGSGKRLVAHRGLADSDDSETEPTRRSGRSNKTNNNMREKLEDEEMFADEAAVVRGPVVVSVREVFLPLAAANRFKISHNQRCDSCGGVGNLSNKGTSSLIHCQGCTASYHKVCLSPRSVREHLATKVGEGDFVLQCRRCVAKPKDAIAARSDICQGCKEPGEACAPFSIKRTSKQEEKLRTENGGVDPITPVDRSLINNADNLLFRCANCQRGFHFEHLPTDIDQDFETIEQQRKILFKEYAKDFNCEQCRNTPEKVQTLVAWRPTDISSYDPNKHTFVNFVEEDKEYLVKWQGLSYFQCTWMPGPWVCGVTALTTRNAFLRRDENINYHPKMTTECAIPEEYLRMEIILDVKYSSGRVDIHTEAVDRARIHEVQEVLVKFEGLGYDEVVWEAPPVKGEVGANEAERWSAYEMAYDEYVAGKYFKQPPPRMKERIESFRSQDFEKEVLLQEQPASLTGGVMKDYQIEGLNYMLYKYYMGKNCILADEMGLGKTIQVIAAISTLIKDKPRCWPFLVVVPNSTCPNWRREIKKWAPSLRVVAYYGVKEARDMAMKYELYPDGCSDMRAHVVVTSFDCPTDDSSRPFFKKIKWTGLFVDEGQRLKNDKNQLYRALLDLKVSFRVLLTGTPLQNNKRELFNLLHFIDSDLDAVSLDEKYQELTDDNLVELHDLIRPYFLRRTKLQVLKDLPAMAQVIIPVSMSTLQKQLYKSVLSKSPELIKSIFVKDAGRLKASERGSLNNLLMQLRKVLCHPYIYSEAVEERLDGEDEITKSKVQLGLVEASGKLQLLDLLLPKLHERGHRVLIFSQFLQQLDIIEDFLIGLRLDFRRLDGTIGTIEKQKRIDEFNEPGSKLFAFLLSTRAGGVGINLATADTVIIMDPDFNPHQDMQALSRAHRIGQEKKVLVFQLMTKHSAEEKIVQIGRKKMALDHVLIERIDDPDDAGIDVQTILRHGAQALFDEDDSQDIRYDSASIDKLLDRSQVENTRADEDKSAESQFSYARIWTNEKNELIDDVDDASPENTGPNLDMWETILKAREAEAAREAALKNQKFGRGKRVRGPIMYNEANNLFDEDGNPSPVKEHVKRTATDQTSDTDFAAIELSDGEESDGPAPQVDSEELPITVSTKVPKPIKNQGKAKPIPGKTCAPKSRAKSKAAVAKKAPRERTTKRAVAGVSFPDQMGSRITLRLSPVNKAKLPPNVYDGSPVIDDDGKVWRHTTVPFQNFFRVRVLSPIFMFVIWKERQVEKSERDPSQPHIWALPPNIDSEPAKFSSVVTAKLAYKPLRALAGSPSNEMLVAQRPLPALGYHTDISSQAQPGDGGHSQSQPRPLGHNQVDDQRQAHVSSFGAVSPSLAAEQHIGTPQKSGRRQNRISLGVLYSEALDEPSASFAPGVGFAKALKEPPATSYFRTPPDF